MSESDFTYSEAESSMAESLQSFDSNSLLFADNVYPDETPFLVIAVSYLCLVFCVGWALVHMDPRVCVYLYASMIIILCYVLFGTFRKFEFMHGKLRMLAAAFPIAAVNAHTLKCATKNSTNPTVVMVLLSLVTLPLILKMAKPEHTQCIIEIIVWSNASALVLRAVGHDLRIEMAIVVWQLFYHLMTYNARTWLLIDPEVPFNFGLGGMCILLCNACLSHAAQRCVQ